MEYAKKLSNVSILGAAGKMGSGILLLMAKELFDLSRQNENNNIEFRLNAIDLSEEGLQGVMKYVEKQTRRAGERKPENIRKYFTDQELSDEELVSSYVSGVLSLIHPTTDLSVAMESTLVFEAASENKELKVEILSEINSNNKFTPWFFTNTSSIPIQYIDENANLGGRILGFHFYNPPAIQKLVELITTNETKEEVVELAHKLAGRLRKVIVPSNDIAGFIGNGHFMRDALYGISEVERLGNEMDFVEAVFLVNTLSQKFLIRPMGIFQLCDYVGLDVVQFIMKVMDPYMKGENLSSSLLDKMVNLGIKGGQNPDGSQKDGFLRYETGKIAGVYNIHTGSYVDVLPIKTFVNEQLGSLPASYKPWKEILSDPEKEKVLEIIFSELKQMNTVGSELGVKYALNSKYIGLKLVEDKVANSENDVNKVLLTGFYHAYGPINSYFD